MSAALDAPLSPAAQEQLSQIARQWEPQQQLWASGFLAGMAAARNPGAALPDSAATITGTVLYGSQTGNAQRLAEAIAETGGERGLSLRAVSMADYSAARLRKEKYLLVVVSTHGEGDPPDDAEELWNDLAAADGDQLTRLRYGVLALGDSSYANFCQTGRDFDQRLAAAGATRLLERVECDLDFAAAAQHWRDQALDALEPHLKSAPAVPALRAVPSSPEFSRSQPFAATVEVNQKITARDSGKDVRHLELSLDGSGIRYQPGDSLAVVPRNPATLVEMALAALKLPGASPVSSAWGETLAAALSRLELTRVTRPLLEQVAAGGDFAAVNEALASPASLKTFLDRYQVVDVLRDFPLDLSARQCVDLLQPVGHRAYSIASSPRLNPETAHLTVAKVAYTAFGTSHVGAASSALSDLQPGDEVDVFLQPNPRFRLPENPDQPVIMIGPGTGVAPFRAFLADREAAGASGRNWLFFGDRHFASDFLYQLDWLRWRRSGLLTRLSVAFSRDGKDKFYVQDAMREQAQALFGWLEAGASVYVCGDASRMAADVNQALLDIIARHGQLDAEAAGRYLQQMKRAGRYRRDVY